MGSGFEVMKLLIASLSVQPVMAMMLVTALTENSPHFSSMTSSNPIVKSLIALKSYRTGFLRSG